MNRNEIFFYKIGADGIIDREPEVLHVELDRRESRPDRHIFFQVQAIQSLGLIQSPDVENAR